MTSLSTSAFCCFVTRSLLLLLLACLPLTDTSQLSAEEGTSDAASTTAPVVENAPPAIPEPEEVTLFDRFQQGGAAMYFLAAMAILSLGIIMERFVSLNRGNVAPQGFMDEADNLWQAGDTTNLVALCDNDGSTLANTVKYVALHKDEGYEIASGGAGEIASRELRGQLQGNYWLAVIATLAPLVGLLGTITGMIESFNVVSVAGEIGDVGLVAGGISKALITTAFGLIVAIPSLAAFHFFKGRVSRLSIALEEDSSETIKKWLTAKA